MVDLKAAVLVVTAVAAKAAVTEDQGPMAGKKEVMVATAEIVRTQVHTIQADSSPAVGLVPACCSYKLHVRLGCLDRQQ